MTQPNLFDQVWQIYDEQRDCLFDFKFFETKLSRLQTFSLVVEVSIVVGTSTTGIAGWALWSQPTFATIWVAIAGIAATLSLVKPVLKLDDKLVKFTKLFGEYGRIANGYNSLIRDIAVRQNVDDDILKRRHEFRSSIDRIELVPQTPMWLREQTQKEVIRQWPLSKYWSPK